MRKVEAVIIAKRPYGESDEIISAVTKDYGKVIFRARGVKKSGAKLAGSLQFLNLVQIHFIVGRGLPIVTDTVGIESFPAAKKSAAKLQAAASICQILDRVLPAMPAASSDKTASADIILWGQILGYFETLERYEGQESSLVLGPPLFVYQMLNLHGFRPTLAECALCGRAVTQGRNLSFSSSAGGVIDEHCLGADPTATPISGEVRTVLERWRTEPTKKILDDAESFSQRRELTQIVERFGEWHLGVPLELSSASNKIAKKV